MTSPRSALALATQINAEFNIYGAMQLQKLLYYSEAWALVLGGTIFEDDIEAWDGGPVVSDVYATYRYSTLGSAPIISPTRKVLLSAVIPFYIHRGGHDLSMQTHEEEPWIEARARGRNASIDRRIMRKFYAKQALLEPDKVPDLPSIPMERPSFETVESRAKDISTKWERTLAILGS